MRLKQRYNFSKRSKLQKKSLQSSEVYTALYFLQTHAILYQPIIYISLCIQSTVKYGIVKSGAFAVLNTWLNIPIILLQQVSRQVDEFALFMASGKQSYLNKLRQPLKRPLVVQITSVTQRSLPFLPKQYIKGMGLDLGAVPPHITLC